MSRKLFVAGNWKMNTCGAEAVVLAEGVAAAAAPAIEVDVAVCPPMVYLAAVGQALAGSRVALGAQNMFYEDNGAFTGEVSAAMLLDVGCRFAILGHSERRHVMGESDELVNRKVVKALAAGIEPILCVGELLEERRAARTMDVVSRQVRVGLEGVSKAAARKVTLAYEPVWAIGTGETASPEQAQEVHAMIRGLLVDLYDDELAASMRIQYGGSVKPSNAADLLGQADVDGALVGGASLTVGAFAGIIEAVA